MIRPHRTHAAGEMKEGHGILGRILVLLLSLTISTAGTGVGQENPDLRRVNPPDTTPTLGLDQGLLSLETPAFDLVLVRASQTVAALRPKGSRGFDFTPSDWLDRRGAKRFFHLGSKRLAYTTVVGLVVVIGLLVSGFFGQGFHG